MKRDALVTGNLKSICLFFLLLWTQFQATGYSFVRVNSGTKSDITRLSMVDENAGFFLADKLYTLNKNNSWSKANYPADHSVFQFSALATDDLWYSCSFENSTSVIYHYHQNQLESFMGPFGVSIYSMCVTPANMVFVSSFCEAAIYYDGAFKKVELAPGKSVIRKIVGLNPRLFWILNEANELYVFNGTKYKRLLPGKKVKDFSILDESAGFALCEGEVVKFSGLQSQHILLKEELATATKIFISPQNEIWLIGSKSKILKIDSDGLHDYSLHENYELTDLSFAGKEDVWISGNDGLLLYSGSKVFPPFERSNPGFSSIKLTNFSIDLDNEYGVAVADFDGDGKEDIYSVCISDFNRLFMNKSETKDSVKGNIFRDEGFIRKSEGTFDVKGESSYAAIKLGVTTADVDNDGDEDVYVCYLNSRNKLLLNNGSGIFRDVSNQSNRACEDFKRSTAAAFADVDLDGNIDLYVTSENGSNKLLHNDGTGHFTDITATSGLETVSGGSCATFGDVNGDGYPDLCLTFWYERNRIYLNESGHGQIKFREITDQTDLSRALPVKSNGATFADINNDGFLDLFIANRNDDNKIYLNDGLGHFRDVTSSYLHKNIFLSNGAVFADFDNDGYKDLYLTNVGSNVLYKNIQGLFFKDVTSDYGADMSGYSTGSAVGDFNNDGNIDLYVANFIGGSSKVFMNQSRNRNTIKFKLEGTLSNRDAIGARVFLYARDQESGQTTLAGFQEVSGGSGYASISSKSLIFPLLPSQYYFAIIKFPYHRSEMTLEDIKPGTLVVKEQVGWSALTTLFIKSLQRTVMDPDISREYLKIGFILLLVSLYLWLYVRGWDPISRIRKAFVLIIFLSSLLLSLIFIYTSSTLLFLLPIFEVVSLLFILHLITERKQIADAVSRQRKKLRERISRDLHDDLASTLGSISIYTDTLKRMDDPAPSEFKKLSLKIADLTQSALQSITDIIWMTSPRNDSLQGLLAKVNNLLYEILTDNGIQYQAEINAPDRSIVMPDELKNDIFLILKEATHNIIRHAKATKVTFIAEVNEHSCLVSLMDNGQGFDESSLQNLPSHGNGLINIRDRAKDSKIELHVDSYVGKGTIIHLEIKI